MAVTSDVNALLRTPGRLVLNPTDLTQAFPYGGTSLGLVRDIVAEPGQEVENLVEENLGVCVAAEIDLGQAWAVTGVVRAPEQGSLSNFLPTEVGAVTGDLGVVSNPVTQPPGQAVVPVKILFAPYDETGQWFMYFPAALPRPKRMQQIAKAITKEAGVAIAFWASPRASDGYAVKWKKKDDMTL